MPVGLPASAGKTRDATLGSCLAENLGSVQNTVCATVDYTIPLPSNQGNKVAIISTTAVASSAVDCALWSVSQDASFFSVKSATNHGLGTQRQTLATTVPKNGNAFVLCTVTQFGQINGVDYSP